GRGPLEPPDGGHEGKVQERCGAVDLRAGIPGDPVAAQQVVRVTEIHVRVVEVGRRRRREGAHAFDQHGGRDETRHEPRPFPTHGTSYQGDSSLRPRTTAGVWGMLSRERPKADQGCPKSEETT